MATIDFSKIRGVILDFGGTLDTDGTHWSRVIESAYQEAGVALTNEDFREAYIYAERELARTLHILPHHNFGDMLLIKVKIELQYLSEHGLFAPVLIDSKAREIADICHEAVVKQTSQSAEVLKALAEKWPLVLVSNFYGNIETVLKDFGILECFKKVIESARVGIRKPDPAIFELGVKALGLEAAEVLVVGDSIKNDMNPAKKLGCRTLLLEGKGWEDTPLKHDEAAIRKLDEILKWVESA